MYSVCRIFVVFLLAHISGKVLTLTPRSIQNETVSVGANPILECNSSPIAPTDEIEWIKYNAEGNATTIFRSPGWNLDRNKYLVENETRPYDLMILKVDAADVGTYCCNSNSSGLQCANVVIINSVTSRLPKQRMSRGGTATLGCSLAYGSPPRNKDYIFPLSNEQVPTIEAFLGTKRLTEIILEEETISNNGTVKSVLFWKKITKDDINKEFICRFQTQVPRFDYNYTRFPDYDYLLLSTTVIYPGYRKSEGPDDVYYIGDRFTCLGFGAKIPLVYWIDKATNQTLNKGIDSAIFVVNRLGAHELICGVKHPVNDYKEETVVRFMATNGSGTKSDSLKLWLAICLPILILIGTGFGVISNVNNPILI